MFGWIKFLGALGAGGQPAKPAKGAAPAINSTLANQVPILAAEQMYPGL